MILFNLVAFNVNFKFTVLKFISAAQISPDPGILLLHSITTGVSNSTAQTEFLIPDSHACSPYGPWKMSILPEPQAKSLGVTLDSFLHVLIGFMGKSCWLCLKNTFRIQTTSHSSCSHHGPVTFPLDSAVASPLFSPLLPCTPTSVYF